MSRTAEREKSWTAEREKSWMVRRKREPHQKREPHVVEELALEEPAQARVEEAV